MVAGPGQWCHPRAHSCHPGQTPASIPTVLLARPAARGRPGSVDSSASSGAEQLHDPAEVPLDLVPVRALLVELVLEATALVDGLPTGRLDDLLRPAARPAASSRGGPRRPRAARRPAGRPAGTIASAASTAAPSSARPPRPPCAGPRRRTARLSTRSWPASSSARLRIALTRVPTSPNTWLLLLSPWAASRAHGLVEVGVERGLPFLGLGQLHRCVRRRCGARWQGGGHLRERSRDLVRVETTEHHSELRLFDHSDPSIRSEHAAG